MGAMTTRPRLAVCGRRQRRGAMKEERVRAGDWAKAWPVNYNGELNGLRHDVTDSIDYVLD